MKMKKEAVEKVSKKVAVVLETVLKVEANSTSCGLIYQPKEPKKMDRFKRIFLEKIGKSVYVL